MRCLLTGIVCKTDNFLVKCGWFLFNMDGPSEWQFVDSDCYKNWYIVGADTVNLHNKPQIDHSDINQWIVLPDVKEYVVTAYRTATKLFYGDVGGEAQAFHYYSIVSNSSQLENDNIYVIESNFMIGYMLFYAIGVEKDLDKAHNFLSIAAKAHHIEAIYTLGLLYYHLEIPDESRGQKCFQWASDKGHKNAKILLHEIRLINTNNKS